jgi:tRNA A37 threonylcarbamoyltransferase TsaD
MDGGFTQEEPVAVSLGGKGLASLLNKVAKACEAVKVEKVSIWPGVGPNVSRRNKCAAFFEPRGPENSVNDAMYWYVSSLCNTIELYNCSI